MPPERKKKFRKKQNETGLETNISDHEGPWRKILSFSSSSSTSWVSPTFCGDGSIAESTGGRSESGAEEVLGHAASNRSKEVAAETKAKQT